MDMKKRIPKFKSIEEERKFWATHSILDYPDQIKPAYLEFPKPKHLLIQIKSPQLSLIREIAFRKGISASILIKKWIEDRLSTEKTSYSN
jgi:hypothetical protein